MILFKYPSLSLHTDNLRISKASESPSLSPNQNLPASKQSDVSSILAIGPWIVLEGHRAAKAHWHSAPSQTHHMCVPRPRAVCVPQKMANLVVMLLAVPAFDRVPCRTERRYSVPGLPVVASAPEHNATTGGVVEL